MQREGLTYEALNSLALWNDMGSITLDQMRDVKLMNRIDTKYILSEVEVIEMLRSAAECGYCVQVIDGVRACRYDTLYYDTAERDMYLVHHNQQLTRQKIRTRTYLESGTTFLEIKSKSNRGRTRKQRIEICRSSFGEFTFDAEASAFFKERSWYDIEHLSPALSTRFTRITLVNPTLTERLTIDLDLRYADVRSGRCAEIEDMAIVELKQDGYTASATKRLLQQMRIAPLKVSKYCIGTALTVAEIKKNRFKAKLRDIEKRLHHLNITITNTNTE